MHELSTIEFARLAAYLARELSVEDVATVEEWITAHPEHQAFLDYLRQSQEIRSIRSIETEAIVTQRVNAVSKSLHARIRSEPLRREIPAVMATAKSQGKSSPDRREIFNRLPNRWRYTVVGIGLSLLCLVATWYGGHNDDLMSSEKFVYMTAPGERATVRLPDGSMVVLNVGSRLEVPAHYGQRHRKVRLDGEGLFTVVPQSRIPFTVTAGPSTTRVLGTTFSVRHYATDTTALIAVRDGKVAVDSTIVSAAQQLVVGRYSTGHVQAANPNVFAFAAGRLVLERMSLTAAIAELNRWYDAEIRFADPTIGHSLIEGSFIDGSPADLSEQLSWSLGFRVVRDGRVLTLYRR